MSGSADELGKRVGSGSPIAQVLAAMDEGLECREAHRRHRALGGMMPLPEWRILWDITAAER